VHTSQSGGTFFPAHASHPLHNCDILYLLNYYWQYSELTYVNSSLLEGHIVIVNSRAYIIYEANNNACLYIFNYLKLYIYLITRKSILYILGDCCYYTLLQFREIFHFDIFKFVLLVPFGEDITYQYISIILLFFIVLAVSMHFDIILMFKS